MKQVYDRFTEAEALSFAQTSLPTGIELRNLDIDKLPPIGFVIGSMGIDVFDLTSLDRWNQEIQDAEDEFGFYLSYMILCLVELQDTPDYVALVYFDTEARMLKGLLLDTETFRLVDRFLVSEKFSWLTHRLDEAIEV